MRRTIEPRNLIVAYTKIVSNLRIAFQQESGMIPGEDGFDEAFAAYKAQKLQNSMFWRVRPNVPGSSSAMGQVVFVFVVQCRTASYDVVTTLRST